MLAMNTYFTDMKMAIGSDHAGYHLKETIKQYLEKEKYKVKDVGCFSEERADYPDYAHKVAYAMEHDEYRWGIIICGSGNGISIAANKHQGIRAALCWNKEIAQLARQHNDANVLALPARFIDVSAAMDLVKIFLSTPFEGGRHLSRIQKIPILT